MKMDFHALSWIELRKYRSSFIVLLGLLVALLIIHFFWIASFSSGIETLQSQVDQQQELIEKYRTKLEQAQGITANMQKQESELKQMQTLLFQGADPYQLAASIGDLLATKDGPKLDIKTYQVLASKEYGLYQEVHIRFNFMTNIDGLYYFLDRIKNFQASILVHEINIQNIRRRSGPDLVVNVILAALMEKA
jgi:Tfp pilus assembly protein PilO